MPLIDVVFLLLTFFVFAMVLMVQVNAEGIHLPLASGGESVSERGSATIALNADGDFLLDGTPRPLAEIQAELESIGDRQLYVAPDVRAPVGRLFELVGVLKKAGIEDVKFIRQTENIPE
ncbi:MAG: biopolymer transporter ExbD [Phycisphaerales bacterium]|nr:biopolymer transporter ExbD [Phycisphaerales bacterium]